MINRNSFYEWWIYLVSHFNVIEVSNVRCITLWIRSLSSSTYNVSLHQCRLLGHHEIMVCDSTLNHFITLKECLSIIRNICNIKNILRFSTKLLWTLHIVVYYDSCKLYKNGHSSVLSYVLFQSKKSACMYEYMSISATYEREFQFGCR